MLVYVSCELNVHVVLVQLSEVLDSKAWAMTTMLKGGRYPSDGDTQKKIDNQGQCCLLRAALIFSA
jgi:hypothetical protein